MNENILARLSDAAPRAWLMAEKKNMVELGVLTAEEGRQQRVWMGNGMLLAMELPTSLFPCYKRLG